MKYNKTTFTQKQKYENKRNILLSALSVFALFILCYLLRLFSISENSEGTILISYTSFYPLMLSVLYFSALIIALLFLIKYRECKNTFIYIFPLAFMCVLSLLRLESAVKITSDKANYTPAVVVLILFFVLCALVLTKFAPVGIVSIIIFTLVFPKYILCFAPFVTAAVFLLTNNTRQNKIFKLITLLCSCACIVYTIINEKGHWDFNFKKQYIALLLIIIISAVILIYSKNYLMLPLCILPIFPLLSHSLYNLFATTNQVLSVCTCHYYILLFLGILFAQDKKIKDYSQIIVNNPAVYIIICGFVMYTAFIQYIAIGHIVL